MQLKFIVAKVFWTHCRTKRVRQDRTTAEKLELLDRYKTFFFLSQRGTAERLGITRGFLQGLIKNEAVIRATVAAAETLPDRVKRKRLGKDEEVDFHLDKHHCSDFLCLK